MKFSLLARGSMPWLLAAVGTTAMAGTPPSVWLTVSEGGPQAPDVVQVDAERVQMSDGVRVVQVRISRSRERPGYDGQPYRSAEGLVRVDCASRSAGYSALRFFDQPRWQGHSRDAVFAADAMPRMAFGDMQPNPSERIVDAACRLGDIKSTDAIRR